MKTYKIKIHKHTPKRYRMSKYQTQLKVFFGYRLGFSEDVQMILPVVVTDLTKKLKGNNKVYCFDTPRGNLKKMTEEEFTAWKNSRYITIAPPAVGNWTNVTYPITTTKPINPHKLGIFENLKHHTIDKLRKGKYNGK